MIRVTATVEHKRRGQCQYQKEEGGDQSSFINIIDLHLREEEEGGSAWPF